MCLLAVPATTGQTSRGGISGTVTDKSGAMVPDAKIELEQKAIGLTLRMPTTSAGIFSFQDVPVGFYNVTISHMGFQTQKVTSLEVQVGRITSLTIILQVAQQTQIVEIQAVAATIETSQSALNAVVPSRAVQEIPLDGRDFTNLLQLTPGFNAAFSMNGSRWNQNNFQIDGADNNDFWHNFEAVNQGSVSSVPGVLLPIDSIEEFNQQSIGGADFGRNPGSAVNVVVKSGTNDFHGTVYYFHRNDALAKESPFVPPDTPSKLRNHSYGFSFGGPMLKDKAFLFFNLEAQRFIAANAVLGTVPSDAWIAEAETLMAVNSVPVNPTMANLLNYLWPSSIRNAPATQLNFCGCTNNDYKSYNGVARIDFAFNSKERLSLRSFVGTGDATAFAGSVYPDYFDAVPSRQQNWALVLNSAFGSHVVNQFLFGVNYFLQNFNDARHDQNVVAQGFNTGVSSFNSGSPNIEINGFPNGGVGENPDLGRTATTYHFTDGLGYTLGAHVLKFGGEFRKAKLYVHYLQEARGSFFFDGQAGPWFTGGSPTALEGLADFLAGYIDVQNATIATGDPRRNYYANSVSWYTQDNWQLRPRLNVNFGLRWDYNGPIYDPTHTISTFLPRAPGGLAFPPQTLKALYPRDWDNFAPRLGFAFTPTRGGKTVIRGAWGIYYDIVNGNLFIDNRASPGGRGVSRNPAGPNPVFTVTNTTGITVVQNQPIFGGAGPQPPFGVYGINQDLQSPYVQNFSLNVQRQLAPKVLVQAGYVGSQARKLIVTQNINQPPPSVTPYPSLQAARPFYSQFPTFSGITQISSAGNSQFNSMQLLVRATDWHGLNGQFGYALGHARDDMSSPRSNAPTDNNNLRGDYSNADFDTRHNVSGYLLYDVPQFGQTLPRLTKGWELSAFWSYNSGFPFTVFSGEGGASSGSHTGNGLDRADLVGNAFQDLTKYQWLNFNAFSPNADGTFGTTKRNGFYGPRFKTIDFSVIKNTPVTERIKTQLRIEMFNVFNILNLAQPDNNLADGPTGFGFIGSTLHGPDNPGLGLGEPFNVQLGLKIIF
jgi:hypothetical protein